MWYKCYPWFLLDKNINKFMTQYMKKPLIDVNEDLDIK
jgi:hypothetical protein